jgi:hypothetical protein
LKSWNEKEYFKEGKLVDIFPWNWYVCYMELKDLHFNYVNYYTFINLNNLNIIDIVIKHDLLLETIIIFVIRNIMSTEIK